MSKCSESYEKKRLEYLLALREKENARLNRELSALREVNRLCAAHLFCAFERLSCSGARALRLDKSEIADALGKFRADCRDGGDYIEVVLKERTK